MEDLNGLNCPLCASMCAAKNKSDGHVALKLDLMLSRTSAACVMGDIGAEVCLSGVYQNISYFFHYSRKRVGNMCMMP